MMPPEVSRDKGAGRETGPKCHFGVYQVLTLLASETIKTDFHLCQQRIIVAQQLSKLHILDSPKSSNLKYIENRAATMICGPEISPEHLKHSLPLRALSIPVSSPSVRIGIHSE